MNHLDPMQGRFRWAFARTRDLLGSFTYGNAFAGLVSLVVTQLLTQAFLPANATTNARLVGAAVAFIAAIVLVVVVALAWQAVTAPRKQRDALRDIVRSLQAARGKPQLRVEPEVSDWVQLYVENLGEPDVFKAQIQARDDETKWSYLNWGRRTDSPTSMSLPTGGHARVTIQGAGHRLDAPFRVRFLGSEAPLTLQFELRRNALGRLEMRSTNKPWDETTKQWRSSVRKALEWLQSQSDRMMALDLTDLEGARALMEEVTRSKQINSLVGPPFIDRYAAVNRELRKGPKKADQPPPDKFVAGYRAAFAEWIAEFERALQETESQ